MQTTTMTRIVLDEILRTSELPEYIKSEASQNGLAHADAVALAEGCLKVFVETSLCESVLPTFAQQIISHALTSQIDWRFISERVLASPESN